MGGGGNKAHSKVGALGLGREEGIKLFATRRALGLGRKSEIKFVLRG
jgi:hypothetical protein